MESKRKSVKEKTVKDKIRIIHMGDLHLDSPFSSLPLEKSEIRRRELRATFTSIIYYAKEVGADIVMISGDLFDDGYASAETAQLLCDQFLSLPDCRFVIAPGNHDPYTRGSIYASGKLPKNVCVFRSEGLSRFVFDDINTAVYGWAFNAQSLAASPLAGKVADDDGRLHLICGHCDLTSPISRYCPVTVGDVRDFGAHYAGFSHIHKTPEVHKDGKTLWSYSGFVEGRSFDECGYGGFNLIEAETCGDFTVTVKRKNVARRRYEWDELDVGGCTDLAGIAARIDAHIREKKYGEDTLLRMTLTGAVSPEAESPVRLESAVRGLFSLEIDDRTSPTFDAGVLENDMTIRGELYRELLPLLQSGSAKERATAAAALKLGLAALEGRNITE